MDAYVLAKLAHVLTAVLAVGLVTSGALLLHARGGVAPETLRPIVIVVAVGLLVMVASGLVMDRLVGGAWHETRWFRIGFGWTIAAALAVAYAGRTLRRLRRGSVDGERARRRVRVAMTIAVACVAAAVIVMVRRP